MTATITYPELNSELLYDLIKWAERDEQTLAKHPDWGFWSQGIWAGKIEEPNLCGSAYCIAGQAVVSEGYRLKFDGNRGYPTVLSLLGQNVRVAPADYCVQQQAYDMPDGTVRWLDVGEERGIASVAKEILGLTEAESSALFDSGNSVEDLQSIANWLADKRGLPRLFPGVRSFDDDVEYDDDDDDVDDEF